MKALFGFGLGHSLVRASLVVTAVLACSEQKPDKEEPRSGFLLQMLVPDEGTDITDIQYTIQPVACEGGAAEGDPIVILVPLENPGVRGVTLRSGDAPHDGGSAHPRGDVFSVLPAGCYDVSALLFAEAEPSRDCAPASMDGVVVTAGQTSEVFLISQCQGDDSGALSTNVGLNREPVIENVSFRASKFACGSPPEVCVQATDPDNDPIEFVLTAPKCAVTAAAESAPGSQCWRISCSEPGADLLVRAYDQIWIDGLVRIEDYLAAEGAPNESHAELVVYPYFDGSGSFPGAAELCDGEDNDCNGVIDDSDACQAPEVVVFNDVNPFDFFRMTHPGNRRLAANLVKFSSGKPRDAGTTVWMDRGRNSACSDAERGACAPARQTSLYSLIKKSGYAIEEIRSTSGSLVDIPPKVKILFLWSPTVPYRVEEINALKTFAAQGGRTIFVGEFGHAYGAQGIAVENAFLRNMGAQMRNTGETVCGFALPESAFRSHPITRGLSGLWVACTSVIAPGPLDFPLYYDTTSTRVLAGVAAIDRTPIKALSAVPLSVTAGRPPAW